jgi:hypothetical protein
MGVDAGESGGLFHGGEKNIVDYVGWVIDTGGPEGLGI